MNKQTFENEFKELFKIKELNDNLFEIETGATFINGEAIILQVEKREEKWYLTDNKLTMKYMNELYDLKSSDVKTCISNVLKLYAFTISRGVLTVEIMSENIFTTKVLDMVMCINQLANMFVFFDKE